MVCVFVGGSANTLISIDWRGQGKTEWAYKIAKQAVNCAPSEFVTWAKLTEVNIELQRYNEALLTLNSCPMFTYNERDLHRMPTPQRTHLPIKSYIVESGILASLENSEADNEADLALLRLPAPSLRGTFKKAYELLARLVGQIGWDDLLRTRSEVFVMEEEYRVQKQMQDESSDAPDDEGVNARHPGKRDQEHSQADDDASTRAVHASGTPGTAPGASRSASPRLNGRDTRTHTGGTTPASSDGRNSFTASEPPSSPIPEIRISQHSGESDPAIDGVVPGTPGTPSEADSAQEETYGGQANPKKSVMAGPAPGVEKPPTPHLSDSHIASTDEAAKGIKSSLSGDADTLATLPETKKEAIARADSKTAGEFSSKRLCERWLDNLFMVLYEVRMRIPRVLKTD